jgi:thiol-disulfide isomerase/thioredoxin
MKKFAVLMLTLIVGAVGYAFQDPQSPRTDSLKPLPPISLEDFNGQKVAAEGLKGSVVVLDFWATWCLPCIEEIPALNKLQEQYGAQGLKVVGVTLASGEPKEVKPFISRHGMKYTILMGNDDQAYDFNIVGFPTTYLLTRDLKVYRKYVGSGPKKASQLESDIKELLGNSVSKLN